MAGLVGLSVDPEKYKDNFSNDLFFLTFYQQHLGEEYSGIACFDGDIKIATHRGLFRPNFSNEIVNFKGTEAISYCGNTREPIFVDSKIGEFCACFSGNIINRDEIIEKLKTKGFIFSWKGEDIELISYLIAQENNIVDGIKKMTSEIKGDYALLVLNKEGIYAARSPRGRWPLAIGEKEGATIVASESGGFTNLDFSLVRDIKAGEIVLLKKGSWETKILMPENKKVCSFLWVYTAFPSAVIEGIPASLVRKRLGAALARKDIEEGFIPDIVSPVPDSGRFHAIGYYQEFCNQFEEGKIKRIPRYEEILLKYPYAGRSYMPSNPEARNLEAQIKLQPSGESYEGKKIVICDDSIVRGTQIKNNLVPKLKKLGIGEIHLRISNPELRSHCPWGKTTRKKEEILAFRIPDIKERIKFLGVDSLKYNSINDLIKAIGIPKEALCIDCDLDNPEIN